MADRKTTKAEPKRGPKENRQRIEKRWGKPLTEAGWTAIPSVLLSHQKRLGLDPLDLNIVLQIVKHWWEPGNAPYPSKKSIADAIGVDVSTVRKRIQRMEKVGLISREARRDAHGGQKTNLYTFVGLKRRATPMAQEVLKERAERKKAKAARTKRNARLTVIDGDKA